MRHLPLCALHGRRLVFANSLLELCLDGLSKPEKQDGLSKELLNEEVLVLYEDGKQHSVGIVNQV